MSRLRILVADGHTQLRQSLRRLLEEQPEWEVVAEVADGREAVRQAEATVPDVVVMDVTPSLLSGVEAIRQIVRRVPSARVLVLSMHVDDAYVAPILEAGAAGYLLKYSADVELVLAVSTAVAGEVFVSPSISRSVQGAGARTMPGG